MGNTKKWKKLLLPLGRKVAIIFAIPLGSMEVSEGDREKYGILLQDTLIGILEFLFSIVILESL